MSHGLRAPLNGNINLVESAVNSGQTPEKVKEGLLIPALRSSKFLLHIINDILDMSQINEKKLWLVFQSENLKETFRKIYLLKLSDVFLNLIAWSNCFEINLSEIFFNTSWKKVEIFEKSLDLKSSEFFYHKNPKILHTQFMGLAGTKSDINKIIGVVFWWFDIHTSIIHMQYF